jgi:two-component system sensor histidine kinase AtoS
VTGLDQIVGDVLAFSREIRARRDECHAEVLLSDACDACLAQLDGIDVSCQVDEACQSIHADASLLHQALINIIRNGAQATHDHGGKTVELGVSETPEHWQVWVRDSGGGIEESVIERMFNPFFTTRAAGTGLGLSIVHRIMDAHGGSVEVQNITDDSGWTSGAIVSLLLPKRVVNELPEEGQGQIVVRAGRMAESKGQEMSTQSLQAQGEIA